MIDSVHFSEVFILDNAKLELGDLVTTILGEYGVVVGFGKHKKYNSDETEYCYVLINGKVCHYLPFALIKIKKKKKTT